MSLLSLPFHLQNLVSVFWNFNFYPIYLGKRSLCPWNQLHFLRNSDKSLLSPEQSKLKEIWGTTLYMKTAEDNNAKINVSPNIPCTFLLFKANAFIQIFSPRNLLCQQVFRMSTFFNSKCLIFLDLFISSLKKIH